jgi:hypothetical protein
MEHLMLFKILLFKNTIQSFLTLNFILKEFLDKKEYLGLKFRESVFKCEPTYGTFHITENLINTEL